MELTALLERLKLDYLEAQLDAVCEQGSVDVCLVWSGPITDAIAHLTRQAVPIELGPVDQVGTLGWGHSVYFRDLDGNLLEFLSYEAL
jgi:catechol 2,3-dioxygenase-like lactoylglutathione lyase family enzyme